MSDLMLRVSRPHPRTRSRGLSPESVQSAPPDDSQVALERPAHNLLMVAEESQCYPAAVEGPSDCPGKICGI